MTDMTATAPDETDLGDVPDRKPALTRWLGHPALHIEAVLVHPCLRRDLDRVPRGAQGRGVGEVEFAEAVDRHAVEERCGVRVHALGDLRAASSDQLGAQQEAAFGVAGDADGDRAWVVRLVVVGVAGGGRRCPAPPGVRGFVVAQAGAGGDEVEDQRLQRGAGGVEGGGVAGGPEPMTMTLRMPVDGFSAVLMPGAPARSP
jgi:hypothetical protein